MPAFYFHKKEIHSGEFQRSTLEIIDGQQRLEAINKYFEDGLKLLDPKVDQDFKFPNFVKNKDCAWGGKRFSELTPELQGIIESHEVVTYTITSDDDNEVRDLFIRLQAGTALNSQDKRDAWPGNFTDFVLKVGGKINVAKYPGWDFFRDIYKASNDSKRRIMAAQAYMTFSSNVNNHQFIDINSASLDRFYHQNVDFEQSAQLVQEFKETCDTLHQIFRGHPKIVGHYIIHLILLASSLKNDYAKGWQLSLPNAFHEFKLRVEKATKAIRQSEPYEYIKYFSGYGHWSSSQPDKAESIQIRHAFFFEEMVKLTQAKKT